MVQARKCTRSPAGGRAVFEPYAVSIRKSTRRRSGSGKYGGRRHQLRGTNAVIDLTSPKGRMRLTASGRGRASVLLEEPRTDPLANPAKVARDRPFR